MNINVQALHTDPKTWGGDSLSWKPDRWLTASDIREPHAGKPSDETFISPPQGSFIPWADGPRVCPGQKFAQVEFVAVIATLLETHRVQPAPQDDQSESRRRQALQEMVDDSAISAITLQMREPKKVALRWEPLS